MRRFERLGFNSDEEYMKAPVQQYKEMLKEFNGERITTQIIMIDNVHYIGFMMFSAKEELYFLHETELQQLKGTPLYDAAFNCYEEVNGGYILTIEEIERLEGSIRYYMVEERRKERKAKRELKEKKAKIEKALEVVEEEAKKIKEEEKKIEAPETEEDGEMTHEEFLGYTKAPEPNSTKTNENSTGDILKAMYEFAAPIMNNAGNYMIRYLIDEGCIELSFTFKTKRDLRKFYREFKKYELKCHSYEYSKDKYTWETIQL